MFIGSKQIGAFRTFQRRVSLLLGIVFLSCTVLQGNTYCFCADDTDDCEEHGGHGHAGDVCSLLADDACEHLTINRLPPARLAKVDAVSVIPVGALFAAFPPALRAWLRGDGAGVCAPDSGWRHRRVASPYQLTYIARSAQILC